MVMQLLNWFLMGIFFGLGFGLIQWALGKILK